ncbi:MAG: FtsX-like permease family protein [Thermodesulfobacteriota bacterium]
MSSLVLKMAWASLARRPTRSLLVVLMIAVSLWGLLLMQGIYDGMTEQMISNAIRSDAGHLSIFARGYRLDPSLDLLVEPEQGPAQEVAGGLGNEGPGLAASLAADPRVASHVVRLRQNGLVATSHYSRHAEIIGVELEGEQLQGRLADYLTTGKYDFGPKGKGAIIGHKLAAKLQVRLGGKIVVSAQDRAGELAGTALRVSGIIRTNNMGLDENAVFIDLARARGLLGVESGVSQLALLLAKGYGEEDLAALQGELRAGWPDLAVSRWDELYPALMQSRVLMRGFSLVVSGLVFGVAGLGIFGVMLVSVLERLREFGIMLAIGAGLNTIRKTILLESLLMGLAGFLAGALAGGLSLLYFRRFGLDLSVFSEALAEFGMDAVTYAIIRFSYFSEALAAVILATLVSVYFSLRVLGRSRPMAVINKG